VPTRIIGRAQWRFAVALSLSVLLHGWLMESHYGKGAARRSAGDAPIAARMVPAVEEATRSPLTLDQPQSRVAQGKVSVFVRAASPAVPNGSTGVAGAASARAITDDTAALSQPSDPTYYAAGDLDVFPKALAKPDLSAALGANHEAAAGKVRATVLIDETGTVNAVRGVEAPARDVEAAARELLLRTRFTPARNKDGRIVKAQVLVALDYDTRAAPISR